MGLFKRTPPAETVVYVSASASAMEAVHKMRRFSAMVTKHRLEIVHEGNYRQIRLKGKPKNIEKFRVEYLLAQSLGMV